MTKHDSDLTCTDNIITTNGCQWSYMNSLLLVCNCTLGTIASQSKTWTAYHITIRNYKRKWYFTLNSTLFRVTSESLDALLPYSLHPICKVVLPCAERHFQMNVHGVHKACHYGDLLYMSWACAIWMALLSDITGAKPCAVIHHGGRITHLLKCFNGISCIYKKDAKQRQEERLVSCMKCLLD